MMQAAFNGGNFFANSVPKIVTQRLQEAILIAGPNGSGKSTITEAFYKSFEKHGIEYYYNADDLSLVLFKPVTEVLILDGNTTEEDINTMNITKIDKSLEKSGKFNSSFREDLKNLKETYEKYKGLQEKIKKGRLEEEMYSLEKRVSDYLVGLDHSSIEEAIKMKIIYNRHSIKLSEQELLLEERKPISERSPEKIGELRAELEKKRKEQGASYEGKPNWEKSVKMIHTNKDLGVVANLTSAWFTQHKCLKSVELGESFARETVLSTQRALEPIRKLDRRKYYTRGIFITTRDPETNNNRIGIRFQQGGHPVPPEIVAKRYNISHSNFLKAMKEKLFDFITVIDNSSEDAGKNIREAIQMRYDRGTGFYEPKEKYRLITEQFTEKAKAKLKRINN